jgi:predicted RNase H-like nuclease
MCVFFAPTRRALVAPSRIAAARILGRGVSCFEWELYSKIKNLDRYLKPSDQSCVFEVHPEISFYVLNANAPLTGKKKKREGRRAREELLDNRLPGLRLAVTKSLDEGGFSREWFGLDDVNDSLVALWSAGRIAAKEAVTFPQIVERDARGLRMAIWA